MIADADLDGDAELDFNEFLKIVQSNVKGDAWLSYSTSLKKSLMDSAQKAYVDIVPVIGMDERTLSNTPYQ